MDEQNQNEIKRLKELYPIHFHVLQNDIAALMKIKSEADSYADFKNHVNAHDIHGRTPVMLATMLGYFECAEFLLENGADANTQNKEMWSLSHEAILFKNKEFLKKVLTYRDFQRALHTRNILRDLNQKFKDSDDFYVKMTWEFTSWLPFVKNMCPSDTYKIYKHGTNIRIDANLLGVGVTENLPTRNNTDNEQTNQSIIFRFTNDDRAEIICIDRSERTAYIQNFDLYSEPKVEEFIPHDGVVMDKLKSPITTTYIDVDNVGFERSQKSGLLSWIGSNEKEEEVEGYACRVFNASNVQIVTKTCFDHLTAEEREAAKENQNSAISSLLGLLDKKKINIANRTNGDMQQNELNVVDYFTKTNENGQPNIGKQREEHVKTNSFNASLWLSESFPLNLREQIYPIIDLMAVRNSKFSRLKRFIELQMPSGFPIRIKIPIFHLINAQVTFHCVNEPEEDEIENSNNADEDVPIFTLKQSIFEIPSDFQRHEMVGSLLFDRFGEAEQSHTATNYSTVDAEDMGDYVYLLERFVGDQTPQTSTYEQQLQMAIQESLAKSTNLVGTASQEFADDTQQPIEGDDFQKALELSRLEEERIKRELEEEEEQLRLALERSMIDQ